MSNMEVVVTNYASWGFYDQGTNDCKDRYQSPPTDWMVDASDKTDFFQVQIRVKLTVRFVYIKLIISQSTFMEKIFRLQLGFIFHTNKD